MAQGLSKGTMQVMQKGSVGMGVQSALAQPELQGRRCMRGQLWAWHHAFHAACHHVLTAL